MTSTFHLMLVLVLSAAVLVVAIERTGQTSQPSFDGERAVSLLPGVGHAGGPCGAGTVAVVITTRSDYLLVHCGAEQECFLLRLHC